MVEKDPPAQEQSHVPVYDAVATFPHPGTVTPTAALSVGQETIKDLGNAYVYQQECLRTANSNPDATSERDRLANWALGLAGEAGEVADEIKKHLFHGKPLDREALLKECGDCAWYLAVLSHELGFSLPEVFASNIRKLRTRFPLGFSTEASLKRADTEEK
jgi:NTP pyrophosphatase (non-canonical NTP hydrolase)